MDYQISSHSLAFAPLGQLVLALCSQNSTMQPPGTMATGSSLELSKQSYGDTTVLVTGANGFLGKHLIANLPGAANIHAVSRSVPDSVGSVSWHQADLSEYSQALSIFETVKPQVVFHMTSDSRGGLELDFVLTHIRNDVQTTANCLVAATRTTKPRFVIPGSMEEPIDHQPAYSPYSAAKAATRLYGQMFHAAYDLPVVIARLFMTYGPGQKLSKLVPYTIQCFLAGNSPRLSSGERLVDWLYVDDAVAALLACGTHPNIEGLIFEVGSGELVSIKDLVEAIYALFPESPPPVFGALPDRGSVRAADVHSSHEILGWRPTISLEEGLRRTIAYHREVRGESSGVSNS